MEKVVVSIADDSLERLPAVVTELTAAGLVVDDVLEALGMVTGSAEGGALARLAEVDGVAEVAVQRVVRGFPSEG
ncbi:hypothetical protein ACFFQW_17760 [Umezawaea endophytica]|uniref:Ketohydroxyglutarate aldolase n=1 Tax=Umezawaea endophytica TaxID=1654476 RepID=A0A9X2VU33_9PSEU|nr:hypothetical protein [Umezawaea endophytica]MCS7482838.1 hypothetical protein [Umezawaea endophytica]